EPAQGYSAPPATPSYSSGQSPEAQQALDAANFKYACALTPQADETFHNPETVTLSVQLTPGLRPGDQVSFSVDGTTLPNGNNGPAARARTPAAGSPPAAVRLSDRPARRVGNIGPTFHVRRPGVISPARQPAPLPQRPNNPRPTPR